MKTNYKMAVAALASVVAKAVAIPGSIAARLSTPMERCKVAHGVRADEVIE
jgi:hypothetical protein